MSTAFDRSVEQAPDPERPDDPEVVTVGKHDVPSLVQLYFAAESWFQKANRAAQACFVGLWLGVLSPESLYATIEEYYTRSGRRLKGHHDYHAREYNRSGLFEWERDVITRYFGDCRRLLVLGAGGGREVLALSRLGYDVDGFESHPDLVVAANELLTEEGYDPTVSQIAPDRAPNTGTLYDGIIVGWGMYMSIQTRRRRVGFLKQLRSQIGMRGPILLSFFPRSGAPEYYIGATIASAIRRVLHRQPVEIGDWLGPFYVHHFSRDEIDSELSEGGFDHVFYGTTDYGHAVGMAH